MPDRYAVIGNPVAHSRSPEIHAAFALQTGEDIEYSRLLSPPDAFAETVAQFRASGGRGANVTVPFKEEAFALAADTSARASRARAANTLRFDDGVTYADNTDGVGLVNDITHNLSVPLDGRRVLIVGAGGAARGVAPALLDAGVAELVVANRTLERAVALAEEFGGAIEPASFPGLAGRRFDVVINATSAGLEGERPDLPAGLFAAGALAYDMVYGKGETPFLVFARAEGAAALADGLGMLVEQAAESFFIWRGVRPITAPVVERLRRSA